MALTTKEGEKIKRSILLVDKRVEKRRKLVNVELIELPEDIMAVIFDLCPTNCQFVLSRTTLFWRNLWVKSKPQRVIDWEWRSTRRVFLEFCMEGDFATSLKLIGWIKESCLGTFPVCEVAASNNDMKMLQWGTSNGFPLSEDVFCEAAEHGDFNMLKWLSEKKCSFPRDGEPSVCCRLARRGELDALKWTIAEKCVKCGNDTVRAAASGGQLLVLKWLQSERIIDLGLWRLTSGACGEAIMGGHYETLMWLRDRGCSLPSQPLEMAAVRGHLDIIKYLVLPKVGYNWKIVDTLAAVRGGRFETFRWAAKEYIGTLIPKMCWKEIKKLESYPIWITDFEGLKKIEDWLKVHYPLESIRFDENSDGEVFA